MNVIDLVRQKGIAPRRVSSHNGGEYHSSCPLCGDGGKGPASNRFHVWPAQKEGNGSWWCRQCGRGGDQIALVMAMDGLSYRAACAVLGVETAVVPATLPLKPRGGRRPSQRPTARMGEYHRPVDQWRRKAEKFAQWAHAQLMDQHPEQLQVLAQRGIDPGTAVRWGLGWNPGDQGKDLFRTRESWGLETLQKKNGDKKRLWLPRGLVIPYRRDGLLQRIRIRRPKVHLRNSADPRYYVLPGSSAEPWLIGAGRQAYTVVETELDGLLIDQAACAITGVLALGAAANMPDIYCHQHLVKSIVILNALDFDPAGGAAWSKWARAYPQAQRWPVPVGKDPGDACQQGVDIFKWILAGLPPAWHVQTSPFASKGLKGRQVQATARREGENDSQASEKQVITATVNELGDLLRRFPFRIINTANRLGIETPQRFSNDAVSKRVSKLIFQDPDCSAYLMHHSAERIDGSNFYTL